LKQKKIASLLSQLRTIPKHHLDHREKKRRQERESKLSREHTSLTHELEQLTREAHDLLGGKLYADVVSETEIDDDEESDDGIDRLQKGNQQYQQQKALAHEVDHLAKLATEEHAQIQRLADQTLGVYGLMRDLHVMVKEQEPQIVRIGENVAQALADIEQSHVQISKASNTQEKKRNRMCWFVVLLTIILIGFILFLIEMMQT